MAGSPLRNKRVGAKKTAKALTARKPTKQKGPNGGARPGAGRPKGKMGAKTESLHQAYERAFGEMTDEQRYALDPVDIFTIMLRCAIKAKAWDEAKASAEKLAPYTNAKLGPKQTIPPPMVLPDGDQHVVIEQIEIIGGAPKRRPFEEALGRGEVDPDGE